MRIGKMKRPRKSSRVKGHATGGTKRSAVHIKKGLRSYGRARS